MNKFSKQKKLTVFDVDVIAFLAWYSKRNMLSEKIAELVRSVNGQAVDLDAYDKSSSSTIEPEIFKLTITDIKVYNYLDWYSKRNMLSELVAVLVKKEIERLAEKGLKFTDGFAFAVGQA